MTPDDIHPHDTPTAREFDLLNEIMRDGFDGIHSRLDVLNGRTRSIEVKVAVQWMLWTLCGTILLALIPVWFLR